MGVHDGHRQRMIQRFMQNGLDGFQEHEILEMLLFYCIPRRNTNELAHELLNAFGNLSGVLNASPAELQIVSGVGENTAAFLKLLPEIVRIYYSQLQKEVRLDTTAARGNYLIPKFLSLREEVVMLLCLDAKSRLLSCIKIYEGSVNTAEVHTRKLLNVALKSNAACVVLAHNHPSGVALPSPEDISTTNHVRRVLQSAGIQLVDHIIVAGRDFVSLADCGACG